MYFSILLLGMAAAGLMACCGFVCLLLTAAARFQKRSGPVLRLSELPPVTLLKPLCGLEPNLQANLESFFQQDYPVFEIIFGARDRNDPALQMVAELRRQYPFVPVKIVTAGEPSRPNAKICSVMKMFGLAAHDYLIISDSDVQVGPDYIARVVQPLLDNQVGMVTCLYRGVPSGGFWSQLEALGMSVEMTAGVLVADLLEGMKFALGPTMAIRRDVLENVGGFDALGFYCSDDYVLGQRVHRSGKKVVLSDYVIDHIVVNRTCRSSWKHQVRWMKSTRFSRPVGHVASVLSFAMPFGILGLLAGFALHRPALGLALLGLAYFNRVVLSLVAGWQVVRDRRALLLCWLYPLRDLTGFFTWAASFFGRAIEWRGQTYLLQPGGFMLLASPPRLPHISVVDEETSGTAVPAQHLF